jgi:hypothetical protein
MRMPKFFRTMVLLVVTGLTSTVIIVAGATGAQAGTTQFWDSFEVGNPSSRWQGFTGGDGVAGYDINKGVAHQGQNNGWLYVGNGWAAERIPVDLNGFFHRSNCAAGVYMQAVGPGAQVGLQIWNPNNGWHVIAETYPWIDGNGSGYHSVSIGQLNLQGYGGTVYLQAIYGTNSGNKQYVRVDDMVLQCSW